MTTRKPPRTTSRKAAPRRAVSAKTRAIRDREAMARRVGEAPDAASTRREEVEAARAWEDARRTWAAFHTPVPSHTPPRTTVVMAHTLAEAFISSSCNVCDGGIAIGDQIYFQRGQVQHLHHFEGQGTPPGWKFFASRYKNNKCEACDDPIDVGDPILWRSRSTCMRCATDPTKVRIVAATRAPRRLDPFDFVE